MSVLIETTIGDLVFDLYTEKRPRSCLNFLKLCKIKYYNFCLFHSIRRNFIAQSGDPTGSGRGGESVFSHVYGDQAKYFDLELKPRIKHRTKGTISFVNNGNDMHGSQFFITLGEGLDFLDGKHTVFGQLAEGFDTLEKLNETICDDAHKPYQDVRISHTVILDDPFDDPKGLSIPDRSPEPTKEQLESGRIGADEDVDDKGRSKDEIQKELEDKELKIGTKILETVGDIDDADLKPPENVLFVCKLNPVTNAEDLKIIFSRFGKILSCEIITDHKTEESLCYGFVEFEEVEACEKAYFKMDNVLIDDRRIHVDFCQSVAKIKKWHKSSLYKKAVDEQKVKRNEYTFKDKSRKENEKYSMVFADEVSPSKKKKNKKEETKIFKKKRYSESESEEERDRREKSKKKLPSRKKRTYSSSSEDDARVAKDKNTKRKSHYGKETDDRKQRNKTHKPVESGLSSDGDDSEEYVKRKTKTLDDRGRAKKMSSRKDKVKSKYSDSDSDDEKLSTSKKEKKKAPSKYSDSESDNPRNIAKSKKELKQRDYSSSDEDIRRREKSKSRKSTDSKRNKSYDDSDAEEYADSKSRKKRNYSSDRSLDNQQRLSKKRSHQSKHRYSSSEDDSRRRSSLKKSAKKTRRRSYSDSD